MEDACILKAVKGPMKGLTVLLRDKEKVVFGRSPKCGKGTLAADSMVGWHQFAVEVRLPQVALRSLGNTNPTYVNGKPCTPFAGHPPTAQAGFSAEIVLCHGDRIQAGRTVFEVTLTSIEQDSSSLRFAPHVSEVPTGQPVASPRVGGTSRRRPPSPIEVAGRENNIVPFRANAIGVGGLSAGNLAVELAQGPPIVHGFCLGRLLKRGSLGATYAARRESDGKAVIIKVARLAVTLTSVQTNEIRHCLRNLISLRHPNVVPLLDFGISSASTSQEGSAVVALCIEHCQGECLVESLRQRGGRLSPQMVYDIIEGSLGALEYAHALGLYHRNLKPHNLFLARADTRSQVFLADFQIPILFRLQREAHPESVSWLDRDAAPFSPPPELADKATAGPLGDLWSLGAIAQYLLTGSLPEQVDSIKRTRPETAAVQKRAQGARRGLLELLQDTLSGRFAAAADMKRALAALDRPQIVRLRRDLK